MSLAGGLLKAAYENLAPESANVFKKSFVERVRQVPVLVGANVFAARGKAPSRRQRAPQLLLAARPALGCQVDVHASTNQTGHGFPSGGRQPPQRAHLLAGQLDLSPCHVVMLASLVK
jgi:hypothetical protein